MKRSKTLILFLVSLLSFIVGCASSGAIRPKVFVDKLNNIPADIPLQFDSRYERFISNKEMEEFHKLQTDGERQDFQDKFWLERDPDPATPENEEKQRIDQLIDNIANEIFLNSPVGVFGLSFRMNGGFRGDMAHVYLLYGQPDTMDKIEGQSFVDLMLWIYTKPENGSILYAFLFYQGGGGGPFYLFSQDSYRLRLCDAVNEIKRFKSVNVGGVNQSCAPEIEEAFRELQNASGKGGILGGNIFAWALLNFSEYDSQTTQGKALQAPKIASEMAKESKARVTGEAPEITGTAGTDYILSSCESCNSMIPAELSLSERFTISGPWKNFDWKIEGEYLELSLKFRIIFEGYDKINPVVVEGVATKGIEKKFTEDNPETIIVVDLIEFMPVAIPPGRYQVIVNVKNTMTKKSNAWDREFVK